MKIINVKIGDYLIATIEYGYCGHPNGWQMKNWKFRQRYFVSISGGEPIEGPSLIEAKDFILARLPEECRSFVRFEE